MLNSLTRMLGGVCVALLLFCVFPQMAQAQTEPAQLAHAVQEIESLDALRSGLASTLEGQTEEPTLQTMKEVCKPVGMKAQQLSKENGWQVKQMAKKYRNPAHAADNLQSMRALAQFERHPEQMGIWERETLEGQAGSLTTAASMWKPVVWPVMEPRIIVRSLCKITIPKIGPMTSMSAIYGECTP
ncbi:MAG: DUF3365 domain-containing protein, partial [Thermosynechococcaceae cyanobacterium]